MCLLFILVDLGQPMRALNVLLYPTPNSVLFYDAIVLNGYLFLNLVIGWNVLEAERNGVHYQSWLKPLIYISIPWAVSIHTVTAYLYCRPAGATLLADRHLGAPLSGLGLCRRTGTADPALPVYPPLHQFRSGQKSRSRPWPRPWPTRSASTSFSFLCEVFVAFYSKIPGHMDHICKYLFVGLHGHGALVPWMWASMIFMACWASCLTVTPATRKNETSLAIACAVIILGTWIDKGLGMISGGFVPNPMHEVNEYAPTIPEIGITLGVYAIGALVLTVLVQNGRGRQGRGPRLIASFPFKRTPMAGDFPAIGVCAHRPVRYQ
jgi:Ni/Fe-hydrogenase subunit HybB-like protein